MLEHHADLATDIVDGLEVDAELHAVDDDTALLPVLDAVDAANSVDFRSARRTADDDALAPHDLEVMSRSTWKWPNHLLRPVISTATACVRSVRIAVAPPEVATVDGF